ncbi:MAG: CopG family transcriptional regulator [Nostoc sp. DedVER02]|uniref:CopG family transcriptional regulator n=1 Tax=unclassified Nostoc TaxID=2593658 RepID=UPI002AD4F01B|nr:MULTISPECIES: CopG family transcriptional regulator [unclassified Nostoc]MDZ7986523.1 CopG family transcriptional regulator [Nostoc sp. DedVER02]MDZ8112429.1 CopG family transcriptional regulator [Nostoc sp. DedVER01b]
MPPPRLNVALSNLTSSEAQKLEQYCLMTGRPATDVIRELVRSLPTHEEKVS